MKNLVIALSILMLFSATAGAQKVQVKGGKKESRDIILKDGCGPVTGVFVDEITARTATVHWSTNGAMYYELKYINLKGPKDRATLVTNLGSVAIGNLMPCSTYRFVIISHCKDGLDHSDPQVFNTGGCN